MATRRFRNKRVRFVAIGAALATAGAAVSLFPSAHAAEEKTPEEIMHMCSKASVIDGKEQTFSPGLQDKPLADSCDFVIKKETDFEGETKRATVNFRNCPPDVNDQASYSSSFTEAVAQGHGKYQLTQSGGGILGNLLGMNWMKHDGALDLTLNSARFTENRTIAIPPNKIGYTVYTPFMHQMDGVWVVKIHAKPGGFATNPVEEQVYEAPDSVVGPKVLPGVNGAPGAVDGKAKAVFFPCGGQPPHPDN